MVSTASHVSFLPPVLTFRVAAVIVVPVFRFIGFSAVLGYLDAGVVIGSSVLGLVGDPQSITTVAELGVVLLLFAIWLGGKIDGTALGQAFSLGKTGLVLAIVAYGFIASVLPKIESRSICGWPLTRSTPSKSCAVNSQPSSVRAACS